MYRFVYRRCKMSKNKRGSAGEGILRVFQGKNDNTEFENVQKRKRQLTVYDGGGNGGADVYLFEPNKKRDAA